MKTFNLTKDHITLMRGLCFCWGDCEYGGPAVDCKRPFGNSGRTQIIRDMAQVMGLPDSAIYDERSEELIEAEADRLENLYRQMPTAIECVFRTQSFEPGLFVAEPYTSEWRRAGGSKEKGEAR